MKLTLIGHDYKYAAEQILLMMFPDELPEYGDSSSARAAEITLSCGSRFMTVTTALRDGETLAHGIARVQADKLADDITRDRLLQRAIKLSFYRAAVRLTGVTPEWGAITGIRPSTLVTRRIAGGMTPERAARYLTREYHVSPSRARLCADAALAELEAVKTLSQRDVALYVGIPFCPSRCAYCSFVSSSVEKSVKLLDPFLSALNTELDALADALRGAKATVSSVYFGGGTPTTLSDTQLDALLSRLSDRIDLSNVREYTVEAGRPDTITAEKLRAMRDHGVNRVSVNPQTMSDDVLTAIGRRHTRADVLAAVSLVRECGIAGLNMDLIAGLPSDTARGFTRSLDEVLALAPENITVHTLSLKKGSRITLEGTSLPGGEAVSHMLDYAEKTLRGAGYSPYYLYRQKFMSGGFENVGWSIPGCNGLYNICMMDEVCTVLSLGGGGVTKLVSREKGKIERIFNPKYPYEYIERIGRIADGKARVSEFFQNGG
jgi:oxygen-independent coproporphyrinogen-3 oxidase